MLQFLAAPVAASRVSGSPSGGDPSPWPASGFSLCSSSRGLQVLPCNPSSSSCSPEQRFCSLFFSVCASSVSVLPTSSEDARGGKQDMREKGEEGEGERDGEKGEKLFVCFLS